MISWYSINALLITGYYYTQIEYAYKTFLTIGKKGWDMASVFKKNFSIDVKIEFVGIWY